VTGLKKPIIFFIWNLYCEYFHNIAKLSFLKVLFFHINNYLLEKWWIQIMLILYSPINLLNLKFWYLPWQCHTIHTNISTRYFTSILKYLQSVNYLFASAPAPVLSSFIIWEYTQKLTINTKIWKHLKHKFQYCIKSNFQSTWLTTDSTCSSSTSTVYSFNGRDRIILDCAYVKFEWIRVQPRGDIIFQSQILTKCYD
jgi:hypothetical protein